MTNTMGEDEVIEALLRLPARNLETRIRQLQEEIQKRKAISREALSVLGTQQLRLEEQVWQTRYVSMLSQGFNARRDFARQITQIGTLKIREMIDCFRDVLRLRERLQEAREQLELDVQKLRLLERDTYDERDS